MICMYIFYYAIIGRLLDQHQLIVNSLFGADKNQATNTCYPVM